jgi:hypothetical protein
VRRSTRARDCHTQVDTLTAFHRGLDAGVLETCSRCHDAHTFHVEGQNCVACHTDPTMRTTPGGSSAAHPRTSSLEPRAPPEGVGAVSATRGFAGAAMRGAMALVLPARVYAQQAIPGSPLEFDHARHTQVECTQCHSVERTHGAVTTTTVRDCRSCHHTGSTAQTCSRCHDTAAVAAQRFNVRRAFQPSVGSAQNRTFPFDHRQHTGVDCARCHIEGLGLSAARVSCSACHEDHHDAGNSCIACHRTPPTTAHTTAAHLSCTGAGCHSPAPVRAAERTRNLCLACHQTLVDHQPGRRCADCHALPAARS